MNFKKLLSAVPTPSLSILKNKTFLLVLVAGILIGVSIYMFHKYFSDKMNPDYVDNREFTKDKDVNGIEKDATLKLFHVNWCMYCKKAMPEWIKFKDDYEGKTINGYRLVFEEYECSNEEDEEIQGLMNTYNIEGYPTIVMDKNGETISFESKPTYETLEQFVNTM